MKETVCNNQVSVKSDDVRETAVSPGPVIADNPSSTPEPDSIAIAIVGERITMSSVKASHAEENRTVEATSHYCTAQRCELSRSLFLC